jgi:acyl dehydratase
MWVLNRAFPVRGQYPAAWRRRKLPLPIAAAESPGCAIIPAGRLPHAQGPLMNTYEKLSDLQPLVGSILGTSDWQSIDQARIDQFASVTGDDQWIHVDPARAAAGPFGTTVAHGHLTLSLLPVMVRTAFKVGDIRMTINYGLNRVRFPAPVPVGSRVRGHFKLASFEPIPGGAQLIVEVTTEREGQTKPVCVAESVARHFT